MDIRHGEDWGEPASLPEHAVLVSNDAEARSAVEAARRRGEPLPPLGLLGGDLCRTLGGGGQPERLKQNAHSFTCDLGSALLDGRIYWFVAHLAARRSWLRGRVVAAMNAAFLGHWNLAPKGHPGDGLLEVLEISMNTAERLKAWPRLRTGRHIPHPGIKTSRAKSFSVTFPRSTPVLLDGVHAADAVNVLIRIEPDALEVFA